jgi:hypothetical protein
MTYRNSTTLYLTSPGATTPIPWVSEAHAPDFSAFTEPTLSVLTKAWNDFIASGQELEILVDPMPTVEPPPPNWDEFNATMLSDANFNLATGTVMDIAPAVALALPAALTQVSTNGIAAFALAYSAFVSIASVPLETRQSWSAVAEANHLPADFTAVILQGNDPE